MSWNRTPALCSTPSTIHVQASVPFLQPQFIQAHYRLDSASHPCRAKPTIATFDPTHSTQTTCSKFAHQMDDPPRTRVRSLLKSAIQCRQLPLPPSPRPLVLPFLCRPTFTSQTRTWLRQFAIQHKPWPRPPPFHAPKCHVTAGKHTILQQALFSHFRWMKKNVGMIHQFAHATNCEHSTHTFRPPHLTTFNTLPAQQDYLQYHSDFSNFWPHMQALKCIPPSNTTVNKHGQHHVAGLDTATCSMSVMTTGFNTFMISGFNTQHILATAFPTATFSTLSPSPTVVVHCRDHAASAMNLCTLSIPLLDCSPKNIRRHNRIHQAQPFTYTSHQFLQQLASQPWLHKCNWGCSPTHHCPTAYILLKQKKHFLAARPIINYRRFIFEKLLKATAIILQQMLQTCMPNTFGLNSLPHFFRGLSTFPLPVPVATRCRTHHPQSRSCRLFHVHPSTTHHAIRSSPSPPVPTATPTRG